MSGALDVYRDLRTWWLRRGVDYWTEDPTDRTGDGWIRVDRLGDDRAQLDAIVAEYAAHLGVSDRKAAASLLAKRLSAMLVFPPTVAWMQWERVPTVVPESTWLRFDNGLPLRVAVDHVHATVRPDDPLADADDCDTLPAPELGEHLAATAYDQTMASVIDTIHTRFRTGTRHLWGNVALTAINSALWSGDAASPWDRGRTLFESRPHLVRTQDVLACDRADTGPYLAARRKTCCLAYEVESHGYCASCSLLDEPERTDTLTTRIGDAWRDRIRWDDDVDV
ncbi:MAG: (2Fe-2S)-binding protein [Actinomycetota bacterium]